MNVVTFEFTCLPTYVFSADAETSCLQLIAVFLSHSPRLILIVC